jgi:hypothetical protein|tara:strand:+ start:1580 stop:2125 length:546 start_codon:yes stop_codon:yes gene_type:complete
MIDPADQLTQALPLDDQPAKRKRGRPATGKAMTPAEKQRAYRERQKAKSTCISPATAEEIKRLQKEITRLRDALVATDTAGLKRIDELRAENKKLKEQLSSRDEKPVRGLSYRKLTEAAFDQVRTVQKVTDTNSETAKAWSFGVYLMWQYLALTMNVQEAALQADEDKLRAMVGLKTRDQE